MGGDLTSTSTNNVNRFDLIHDAFAELVEGNDTPAKGEIKIPKIETNFSKIQVPFPKLIEIQTDNNFQDEEEGFDEFVSAETIKKTPKVEAKVAEDLLGLFETPSQQAT